jgi:organic hydroperoxide reductase OsmC/OhrA
VATVGARTFEYSVALDDGWNASSDRGGTPLPNDDDNWTPEHLLLTALSRCTLTSFRYHARRAGVDAKLRGRANGVVTRREEDGRFAFVSIDVDLEARLEPALEAGPVRELIAKAERDCFVGASLRLAPRYRWTVAGEAIE